MKSKLSILLFTLVPLLIPASVWADSIAPSSITTLAAWNVQNKLEVDLSWTSPGDDDWTGDLTGKFRIDYATYAKAWDYNDYQIEITTDNCPPYSEFNRKVTGLVYGKNYRFRIWTADEAQNWSGISNEAWAIDLSSGPSNATGEDAHYTVWIESFTPAELFNMWEDLAEFGYPGRLVSITNVSCSSGGIIGRNYRENYFIDDESKEAWWQFDSNGKNLINVQEARLSGKIELIGYNRYGTQGYIRDDTWHIVGDFITDFRDRWKAICTNPDPVAELSATPLEGAKIKLEWLKSTSSFTYVSSTTDAVAKYNIYYDTGNIDFSVIKDSVAHPAENWTSPALIAGQIYKFVVRAEDSDPAGGEEKNTNVVAATAVESLVGSVKAVIKIPQNGKKISGERLTVMAEILPPANSSDVKYVKFEFKESAETTWQEIPAASQNNPNPDYNPSYFIHWNVDTLLNGNYNLRAVATDKGDNSDPQPMHITITVDYIDPDVEERIVNGSHQKREKIQKARTSIIRVASEGDNNITIIEIPENAIDDEETMVKITINPNDIPIPGETLNSASQYREIELESGQKDLNEDATITIPYANEDDNGLVDGTTVRVDKLALYAYNTGSAMWQTESASSIDRNNKTVTAQTSHFSLFGLFAPSAANLSDILVYPVPWVPNDGIADNGKPYNAADPTSGIVFDNMTQSVRIRIFTVSGELVWEKVTDTSSGKVQWNGKNRSNRNVASGGYFAVITNTATGNKVLRKIAIIR